MSFQKTSSRFADVNGTKVHYHEMGDGPTLITDELVAQRLEAAMDPRIVAQPPMRPGPGGPPEDLWRDTRLTRLPHETLIVWGREDRVLPLDNGMILLKQIQRASMTIVPQCGHWVMWEQAAAFNRIALSFFGASAG
ncbi:MAG: hypothetical protein RL367_845 [Pseudomonadota bacterium]|jgi:4,5:9,10-diseco-3-hydroxy-5,9,17-trioxoandrosta-1(10),2-diene-4-oate hydrolase